MQTINSMLVSEELRPHFLPIHFGRWMLKAEAIVYNLLSNFCEDYTGGFWNFYELSNGGFYMAPDRNEALSLMISGNYFHKKVSADAAGIIATLFALSYIAELSHDEKFVKKYHLLLDFVEGHPEGSDIFAAID